tara:strand:+ start:451 stop:609 length:159 start_codon:yes stop_codon:yes gene_type:complete
MLDLNNNKFTHREQRQRQRKQLARAEVIAMLATMLAAAAALITLYPLYSHIF